MAKARVLRRMDSRRSSSSFSAAANTDNDASASAYLFQHVRSVSETAKAEAVTISNTNHADGPPSSSLSKSNNLKDENQKLQQKRPKNTKTRRQKLNNVVGRSVLPKLKKNLAGIITSTSRSNPSSLPASSASSSSSSPSGDVDTSFTTQESSDSAASSAPAPAADTADIILLFDHSDEVEVDDQSFATSGTTGDVTTATGATALVGNLTGGNDNGRAVLSAILDISANMSGDDNSHDDFDEDFDEDDPIIIAGSAVTIDYVYQNGTGSAPTARLPSPTGSIFPRTTPKAAGGSTASWQPSSPNGIHPARPITQVLYGKESEPKKVGILDRLFSCGGGCDAYSIYDM